MVFVSTVFGFGDLLCYGPLPGNVQLGGPLPWQAVVGIFFMLSLRSRVFSPLDNSRPALRNTVSRADDTALKERLDDGNIRQKFLMEECEKRQILVDGTMDRVELESRLRIYLDGAASRGVDFGEGGERLTPSWMPPGVVFPLMWVGVVAPLRAVGASLLYETSSGRLNEAHLNDPVLLWLVLHLAIGDTWNTVNNVERRMGAAVPGVVLVWLSALFAAKQFYDVQPQAGLLLGATGLWITVAGLLVADIWRLNNEVEPEPLYPWKRPGMRSDTRLTFEDSKERSPSM